MTPAEFLLARIAEDEALAATVMDRVGGERAGEPFSDGSGIADRPAFPSDPWGNDEYELDFMARFDPRRVLAECEAKRRIVERVQAHLPASIDMEAESMGDDVLALLALPYADHVDYDSEWTP